MKNFLLVFFLIFAIGCEFVPFFSPIVQGVITWIEGEAHKYYSYDSQTVYFAVKRAAKELELAIQEDGPEYVVVGENDRFKIKIITIEEDITKVSIRINFMGDKPYAELFYKEIDSQLGIIEFENGQPQLNLHR
jgi:hypothetical protein